MTGIPKEIMVSYSEIASALDKSISKIEESIHSALEHTPPELSADIFKTGIYLAGGGALLRGLDKRISQRPNCPSTWPRIRCTQWQRHCDRLEKHRSLPLLDEKLTSGPCEAFSPFTHAPTGGCFSSRCGESPSLG